MKSLLQRRPFGVPLHASAEHFALALAVGGVLLDLVAWLGFGAANTTAVNVGAYALLLATVVVGVIAALAAAGETIDYEDEARQSGWIHTGLLALFVLLAVANAAVRSASLRDQVVPPLPLFLSLVTLVLIAVATVLGGQLAGRELELEVEDRLEEEEPTPIHRRRRR